VIVPAETIGCRSALNGGGIASIFTAIVMMAVAAAGPADRFHGTDTRVVLGAGLAILGGMISGLLGFAVITMQLKRWTSMALGLVVGVVVGYVLGVHRPLTNVGSWNTLFMAACSMTFPLAGLIASMYLSRLAR
jgi:hypothetical protein